MRVSSGSNRRGTIQNEMVAHLVVKFWLPSMELLRVGFTVNLAVGPVSRWAACSVYGMNWDFHRHFLRLEWNARHDLFREALEAGGLMLEQPDARHRRGHSFSTPKRQWAFL